MRGNPKNRTSTVVQNRVPTSPPAILHRAYHFSVAMDTVALIAALLTLWTGWYLSFPRNYQLARKTGLPILISPVNPANPLWLVLSAMFQPALARYLPSVIYDRIKVAIYGWEFRCRYTVNTKLGPAFVLVTTARNEIWIADPEMAYAVLVRRNDFKQLEMASRMFLSMTIYPD